MEKASTEEALELPSLPLPLPTIPSNVKLESLKPPKYSIVSRSEVGTSGRKISLLANHFKVSVNAPDAVTVLSEDSRVVESKRIGRKLVDKLYQTYSSELAGKRFAYDGEKSLYTVGPLPQNKFEFTIVLEDSFAKWSPDADGGPAETGKRTKRSFQSKTYKVELSYSAKIPLKSISLALKGVQSDDSAQDALRVLDIILRQQAADRGCLLVRQSFFQDDSRNYVDLGGGVLGLRGFHSSFRPTQGGLSLNMDVSTTMILRPGPVFEFLKQNLNLNDERFWLKARRMLKNMRIKTRHRNMEFKITGLSEKPCCELYFPMKVKNGGCGEVRTVEITVYEYFTKHCGIELTYSADMPCLDVGKPKRPNYLPLELCSLVSLQRYTKALTTNQRATLVERSRQKPRERIQILTDALKNNKFNENPVLSACEISIGRQLTEVEGRILETPRLKVGNHEDCIPRNGRWNYNNK
ncbi:hypothetical protein Goarm_018910, partial [Gossypium armourianum]|nr:hypothetical protein [Gossypium armourianum]